MLQRYELDVQVRCRNVTGICTGHAVHYQNVAKTFKIKSEAVIITH